jgi:protein-L-isoaspartate O-methyltransferase
MASNNHNNYKETIKDAVLDENTFVRLTLKGQIRGDVMPWRRVVVRPVLIKDVRHLQFSHFDARRDITKNYRNGEAEQKLGELLDMPFHSAHLEATDQDLQVQIRSNGKAILHRGKRSTPRQPELSHDQPKDLPLPSGKTDSFLQKLGIMDKQGRVNPSMAGKFAQINEFLKLLEHTGELQKFDKTPINILDCGSGSSYLSFAVHHYLNDVLNIPANLVGIDLNGELVDKSNANVEQLDLHDLCFRKSAIIDYKPEVPPDIVLALHACDTATDEAIVQGISAGAHLIVCVPCCHHDLHEQLKSKAPFEPVLQHGILKQRMADILTDTFRALALRIMGYKTDVIQFVSSEHTDRNVMIRAVKRTDHGGKKFLREYNDLKAFWGVIPYIEKLLAERNVWPDE